MRRSFAQLRAGVDAARTYPSFGGTPAGITLHYIGKGIDTGDIIDQIQLAVLPEDTCDSLARKLELEGIELVVRNWQALVTGRARATPQPQKLPLNLHKHVDAIAEIELDQTYTGKQLIDVLRALTIPRLLPGAFFVDPRHRRSHPGLADPRAVAPRSPAPIPPPPVLLALDTTGQAPGQLMRGAVPIIDMDILRSIQGLPLPSFCSPGNDKRMDTAIQAEDLAFLPRWIADIADESLRGGAMHLRCRARAWVATARALHHQLAPAEDLAS